ncbi:hypothetical protein Cni_G29379 [Canna indica]|uniref:Uncharacterized protein n=1 Tax=Canna indica TaxID=4628 RepID=A0AAQ3L512_9LILI|nr:hypothetical protein Cni_G29379 [Canna indica]
MMFLSPGSPPSHSNFQCKLQSPLHSLALPKPKQMVFQQRTTLLNPWKRSSSFLDPQLQSPCITNTIAIIIHTTPHNPSKCSSPLLDPQLQPPPVANTITTAVVCSKDIGGGERDDVDIQQHITTLVSMLADVGCTASSSHTPPPPSSLPIDPFRLCRQLEFRLSVDPSLPYRFIIGFSAYICIPQNLKRSIVLSLYLYSLFSILT